MIYYARTSWYGLGYLLRCNGSLIPRCLPAVVLAGVISGVTSSGVLNSDGGGFSTELADTFGHSYAMQILGVVFGFLSVTRMNMSYQRYWEGISAVKVMHSKWTDACVQVLTFDCNDSHGVGCGGEPFREYIVRLFCQLSAVATITLHLDEFASFHSKDAHEQALLTRLCVFPRVETGQTRHRTAANLGRIDRELTRGHQKPEKVRCHGRPSASQARVSFMPANSKAAPPRGHPERRSYVISNDSTDLADPVFNELDKEFVARAVDPVHATCQRILRSIATRHKAGGIAAPPPIVSRIFQEISNGMMAFNEATKMKEVPVPFVYVQFNALLFCAFTLITPVAIGAFTPSVGLAILIRCAGNTAPTARTSPCGGLRVRAPRTRSSQLHRGVWLLGHVARRQ